MDRLWRDIKYSMRSLARARGFTLAALVALTLGIGANSALFSVVHGILLKPLPYRDAESLVMVWVQFLGQDLPELKLSPPEYVDFRDQTTVFSDLVPSYDWWFNVVGAEEPERVKGTVVSAELFEVLGVDALVGRPFTRQEDVAEQDGVVVLSEDLWRRRYGGDQDVVGETVTLNNRSRVIVGVMPEGFQYPTPETELWIPLAFTLEEHGGRWAHYLSVLGRLEPDVTLEEAQTQVSTVARRIQLAHQEDGFYPDDSGWGAFIQPLRVDLVGDVRPALWILFGAVTFVLLIACSIVANLSLARSEARTREIGLRGALGAGRWHIVRQLLTESMMLALWGGLLGVFLAVAGVRMLVALRAPEVPRLDEVSVLDGQVLLYTLGVTILTGLLFGVLPALRATRVDLSNSLKPGARGSFGLSGRAARSLLVVVEVALSLVLLVGAGLLVRSFVRLSSVEPGFDPEGVLTVEITLPRSEYPDGEAKARFFRELAERVRPFPGVEEVGLVSQLPLSGNRWSGNITFRDRPADPNSVPPEVDWRSIDHGYLRAMGIPLVRGRGFTTQDESGGRPVALIDRVAAQRFWPDRNPLGRVIKLGAVDSPNPWLEIVGIVGAVKHEDLSEELKRGTVYVPHVENNQATMTLVVRSAIDPENQIGPVKEVLGTMNPNLPTSRVGTMEALVWESLSAPRLSMLLLTALAGLALVLTVLATYAVVSYSVRQRSREIGIRMAMGAERGRVLGMVVRQGTAVTGLGLLLGLAGAYTLTQLMSKLLYEISAKDLMIFTGVPVVVFLTALGATLLPARRASRTDPMVALRDE